MPQQLHTLSLYFVFRQFYLLWSFVRILTVSLWDSVYIYILAKPLSRRRLKLLKTGGLSWFLEISNGNMLQNAICPHISIFLFLCFTTSSVALLPWRRLMEIVLLSLPSNLLYRQSLRSGLRNITDLFTKTEESQERNITDVFNIKPKKVKSVTSLTCEHKQKKAKRVTSLTC